MNKIMELVRRVLVSESNEDLNLIQAEVARMEAELEAAKADIERYVRIASEQEAKLAALEAQKPKAYINHKAMMPPTLDWAGTAGTLRSEPLYLAAGAKP